MFGFDLNDIVKFVLILAAGVVLPKVLPPDIWANLQKLFPRLGGKDSKPDTKPDDKKPDDAKPTPSDPASLGLIVGLIRRLLGGVKLFGASEPLGHDDEAAVAALASVVKSDPAIAAKIKELLK